MPDTRYPMSFQQAELEIEGRTTIKVLFNPTEYRISKANTWNYRTVPGKSLPPAEFGGGMPRVLTLTLFLDQSLVGPAGSVRGITDELFAMMEPPEGKAAGGPESVPPFVTFKWGSVTTFKAVCTSVSVTFQLFHPNGEPIRAEVALELRQADKASASGSQRPVAGDRGSALALGAPTAAPTATAGGLHALQDGDSLPSVAHAAFGDPSRWRDIAQASNVDNPLDVPRGRPLTVPPR